MRHVAMYFVVQILRALTLGKGKAQGQCGTTHMEFERYRCR